MYVTSSTDVVVWNMHICADYVLSNITIPIGYAQGKGIKFSKNG